MATTGATRPEQSCWDHWSWDKMIRTLSDEDSDESRVTTKLLWRIQSKAFRRLREAFDDPSLACSFKHPFLEIKSPFPYSWGIEIPDATAISRGDRKLRDGFAALKTLTAGLAVELREGQVYPLFTSACLSRLRGVSGKQVARYLERWIDRQSWLSPLSYGDRVHEDPDDGTILAHGKDRGFQASLYFWIFPHAIDKDNQESFFRLLVGVPWLVKGDTPRPDDWSTQEKEAFWRIVDEFFLKLRRARKLSNLPEKIGTEVAPTAERWAGFERFEALFSNHRGISYIEKTTPRPLTETAWQRFPSYVVGASGPELDITDGAGTLEQLAGGEVVEVMLHPGSERHRRELRAAKQVTMLSHLTTDEALRMGVDEENYSKLWDAALRTVGRFGWLSREMFEALATAPSVKDALVRARLASVGGRIAGDMLLYLLTCSDHHPEHMSVRKAAFVMSRGILLLAEETGDSSNNYGLSTIKEYWRTFRPVSHLWAAFRIWENENYPMDLAPMEPEGLVNFLAVAEELRQRGESRYARSQAIKHGPILDPTSTWRPPPDLVLPPASVGNDGPLSAETLLILEDYRAKSGT